MNIRKELSAWADRTERIMDRGGKFKRGDVVEVRAPWRMGPRQGDGGYYSADGHEGTHTVVRVTKDGTDLVLVSGTVALSDLDVQNTDVMIHVGRCTLK